MQTLVNASLSKIVSGGQTGADRGGLDAALDCDFPHGGWCPLGRRAEDGPIPERYRLRESEQASYLSRTERNVVDSDATVIFTMTALEGGSLRTAEMAEEHGKPWLHLPLESLGEGRALSWLAKFIREHEVSVLNVAGSRASKEPSLQESTRGIMRQLLRSMKEEDQPLNSRSRGRKRLRLLRLPPFLLANRDSGMAG